MKKSPRGLVWSNLCLLTVVIISGCTGGNSTTTANSGKSDGKTERNTQPPVVKVSAELNDKLAAADKVDGKEDKVISNCYVCLLGMAGKEEYSAKVNDYTVRCCSKHCCEHFEAHAEEVITSTKIPEGKSSDSGASKENSN